MSQVEKLEALLTKIQANRRHSSGGAPMGMPAPLASQSPISVAPVSVAPVSVAPVSVAPVSEAPASIAPISEAPAPLSEPPTMISNPPAQHSEPAIEVGGPDGFADALQPEALALPSVLQASGSPWEVVGTPRATRPQSFGDLLELSLSLRPR